ncbi:hypothetical protein GQX74_005415 [Glossina fuscipes]|nr:hypothetical protein GQX74_005415 [Glossina fuscipes]
MSGRNDKKSGNQSVDSVVSTIEANSGYEKFGHHLLVVLHLSASAVQQQSQQQALLNKSNDDLRRKRPETTRPNHILLFTIINPFYPITVNKPPIPRCVRQTQKGMN